MYLKALSLAGFKSFAHRTRLAFESGVNVIVGPNGSGKSNLVDAVAWVLGTRATSALRTERMDDVIFSGTATRPPLGRAEVSLTFDNDSGALPLDLPEVTLTRRLYRDGTSEYEINGTQCRLLDIQELLADGGVGRHQHVIVGQGRIGAILSARPDEHRAVIEEAAGVTKHRQRRDRAVRRLEQTEVDVARLNDLLGEQQRRMRPLRRQARAAERHEALRAEARALRLYLGGEELRAVRGRLAEVEAERSGNAERVAAAQTELEGLAASLTDLGAAAGEMGEALERDTAAAARLETTAERLHRVAMVARERRLATASRIDGAGARRRDLESELEELTTAIDAAAGEERHAAAAVERSEATIRSLEDEERSLAEQADLPAEGVVASLRGDLRGLESAAERDRQEAAAIDRRLAVVAGRIDDESRQAEQLVEEIRLTDAEVGRAHDAYQAARAAREDDQLALEAAETAARTAELELAAARARLDALEAARSGLVDPAARDVVAEVAGVVGTVAGELDVPDELAMAVEAALAVWSDAYAAAGPDAVAGAVGALKAAGGGGVPIVTATESRAAPAREVAAAWGLDALVDVLGPGANRDLAETLLGDVVLVEGWSAAWDLVRRHPSVRAVTPEGDVVMAAGVRAAVPDGAGAVALEQAAAALEAAERDTARATSRLSQARRSFESGRDRERIALEALEALEARVAGSTEALAMVKRAIAEGEAEGDRLEDRRATLADAAASRDERVVQLRKRIAEFEGEEAERHRAWESLQDRRREVASRRQEALAAGREAAAGLATVAERVRISRARLEVVQRELHDAGVDADPAEIDRMAEVEERARHALQLVRNHVAALRRRQRTQRAEAGEAGRRLESARQRRAQLEEEVFERREALHQLDVEAAELRVRDEAAAERLRRDADATEEEALAAPAPEPVGGVSFPDHLDSLDSQLRRLGPVNPLAAAEYRELAERVEFLEGQLEDLEAARRDLRKVIRALDQQIASLFREAFEDIDRCYQENFSLLFPGGIGRLRLTDPDDVLVSGVELAAQPLGKRISKLSLLSGGERSLAALAFLFAVFRARPSPFYLLDEVEAALDDANLHRFIRLVDTLRGSAQLTIVTHQQQTMEAADILYGVTMEPGESSQVLAKRLVPAHT